MSVTWLHYYKQCQNLFKHLYQLFALTLDLDEYWFPRSRITGSVCGRKRPSTIPLQSYATVFCRITCARITIVYLRDCILRETIVDGEIRRKTDTAYGFRIQESYTVVFLSVYNTEIYDRNTGTGNTTKYGDTRSFTIVPV